VVVYNNRRPSLYINGVKVKDGLTSPRSTVISTRGPIGGHSYGYYHGYISDVSIYNYILSDATIMQHYLAGKQEIPITPRGYCSAWGDPHYSVCIYANICIFILSFQMMTDEHRRGCTFSRRRSVRVFKGRGFRSTPTKCSMQ
jgi:hypothetical protein